MTPEQKQVIDEITDLSKFAATEAVKRIMTIADVMPCNEARVMVGIKASRTLFTSFMVCAVEHGMPEADAVSFLADAMHQIVRMIEERNKGEESEDHEAGVGHA